ncbi:unnamed protein product [Durusdinium trenchii]|uniref:NYN domain-containing protein n=1 Tax=Durusdinium trenchii TaxID=1381693 RepID=A0ABP0NUC0_9DINO
MATRGLTRLQVSSSFPTPGSWGRFTHACARPRGTFGECISRFTGLVIAASIMQRMCGASPSRRSASAFASSLRTELLVDADIHSIEDIMQAISCLKEKGGRVHTQLFLPPERSKNKKWSQLVDDPDITFTPVPRSSNPSSEPNDEAILSTMLKLSTCPDVECIGLLTSDVGYRDKILQLKSARQARLSFVVLVPEYKYLVAQRYRELGLKVVALKPKELRPRGSRVRAILHASGSGSVQLADPFYEGNKCNLELLQELRSWLERLGYMQQTDELNITAACAKFWFTNRLGSLTVYPDYLGIFEVYKLMKKSSKMHSWKRYSRQLALFLPRSSLTTSKHGLKTYGSARAGSIFKGGGPFLLKESKHLTTRALRRLGYLDDNFNTDEFEAMFCFANARDNKYHLRKMDLLPDHGDRINDLRAKLHTAFLSNRYPGQWQIAQDLCLQVKQILLKEQLLNTSEPGCSRHKMMNAMNAYVKRYELISMHLLGAHLQAEPPKDEAPPALVAEAMTGDPARVKFSDPEPAVVPVPAAPVLAAPVPAAPAVLAPPVPPAKLAKLQETARHDVGNEVVGDEFVGSRGGFLKVDVDVFLRCRLASTREAAGQVQLKAQALAQDPHVRSSALGATAGAALGTAGGAATGLTTGTLLGAAVGVIPAVFTFGLSIPFCAAVGGGAGLAVGAASGATCGAVAGGATGYGAYRHRHEIRQTAHKTLEQVTTSADFVKARSLRSRDGVMKVQDWRARRGPTAFGAFKTMARRWLPDRHFCSDLLSASALGFLGDLVCQLVVEKRKPPQELSDLRWGHHEGHFEPQRLWALTVFGGAYTGGFLHFLYKFYSPTVRAISAYLPSALSLPLSRSESMAHCFACAWVMLWCGAHAWKGSCI